MQGLALRVFTCYICSVQKFLRACERNSINTKENQRIKTNMLTQVDRFIWIITEWLMLGTTGKTLIGAKLPNVSIVLIDICESRKLNLNL